MCVVCDVALRQPSKGSGSTRPQTLSQLERARVQEHCRQVLPSYMVPQHLFGLSRLPVTSNGKVDRAAAKAAMEAVLREHSGGACVEAEPNNNIQHVEEFVSRSIARILGLAPHQVLPTCNFFELGGTSMQAVQVVLDVRR